MLPARSNSEHPSDALSRVSLTNPDAFTAPRSPIEVVRGYERARRQRLVRLTALGVAIVSFVLVPSTFFPAVDGVSLVALMLVLAGSLSGYLLNRANRVSAGAYLALGGGTLGVMWLITARAILQPGLAPTDLRLYDFFVLPILVSGILSNRRAPIIVGAVTSVYTLVSLLVLPHTAALQLYWDGRDPQTLGSLYDVIAIPIVIQALTALVAWLGADSIRRALLEATRAQELAVANERILAQAAEIALQRQRLREGIGHIQQVHTAFTRGMYEARVRIPDGELLPLAMSINTVLDYVQRQMGTQTQRQRADQGAHALAEVLRRVRGGGGEYVSPGYTGTAFDEVLAELAEWHYAGRLANPYGPAGGRP
ncbi:MAG TPA: hypothetical protein VGN32_00920 [Ktedonobacterales bacterium]|jgi:HAMP domain-containing protein|nr:hypothetical protein [Ktedonobacterales bacterium]